MVFQVTMLLIDLTTAIDIALLFRTTFKCVENKWTTGWCFAPPLSTYFRSIFVRRLGYTNFAALGIPTL